MTLLNTPTHSQIVLRSYAVLLMLIGSILATVVGFRNRQKFPELKFLYFYPFISLIETLNTFFTHLMGFNLKIQHTTDLVIKYIFLFTEFSLVYLFFIRILKSESIKQAIKILAWLYFLFVTVNWLVTKNSLLYQDIIYILQGLFLLFPGLYYFIELFKKPQITRLTNEPSFWVVTGVVFYFATTLPLFLMKDFIFNQQGFVTETGIYTINNFCYGIFFLLITKAYLCRRRETQ